MIPPIVRGLIVYLEPLLASAMNKANVSIWDGEVPRFDANGNPVDPSNADGSWPVIQLEMSPSGMNRNHTFTDAVKDIGNFEVIVYGTTRAEVESTMNLIDGTLGQGINIQLTADFDGPPGNPNYTYDCSLQRYVCRMEPGRTAQSLFLYKGEMEWTVKIHTNAPATQ